MCSWVLLCESQGLGIFRKASAFRLGLKSVGINLHNRAMPSTKPNVVFVLGGPGAGKGTQCDKIVEKFRYAHLSAGDLLRSERSRDGSEFKELIEEHIKQGKIVPVEITCKLLENAMLSNGGKRFLIDGFPRNKDNLEGWTNTMADKVNLRFVLFFDCSDEICKDRCLGRGQAGSGRSDDNEETLKKRIATYVNETMPIIKHYEEQDLVRTIDASRPPDQVFSSVCKLFEPLELEIEGGN